MKKTLNERDSRSDIKWDEINDYQVPGLGGG